MVKSNFEYVARVLDAIADGYGWNYEYGCIVVPNPKYRPDDGSDPQLVLELKVEI